MEVQDSLANPGAWMPPIPPAPVPPVEKPTVSGFKGLPVRAEGDNIYLLRDGKRFWVTSAEVYERLGFKFGDEAKLDQKTLEVIPEGEPLR